MIKLSLYRDFFTKRITGFTELSYTDRLRNLGLETLERRRLAQDLALCYKILFGLCDVSVAVKIAACTRGNSLKLAKPSCSSDVRKYFFSNRIVDAWNSLSDVVVQSPSVKCFMKRLCSVNLDNF